MMELTDGVSDLDSRLAEIDRRLRDIQAEIAPDRVPPHTREPEPPREAPEPPREEPEPEGGHARGRAGPLATLLARGSPPPPPGPPPLAAPPDLTGQLAALAEVNSRLVTSLRELLEGYERLFATKAGTSAGIADISITAGPFTSTEALRAFERSLAALPGVREVAIRGYEGEQRAIVEVTLGEKS